MQGVLYFSLKDMGAKTGLQGTITKITIGFLVLVCLLKIGFIINFGIEVDYQTFVEFKEFYRTLGYSPSVDAQMKDEKYTIDAWGSFDFEMLALFLNFLLVHYYRNQSDNHHKKEKIEYINHSLFLEQYGKFQLLFFFAIVLDSFYSQTFTQMIMLAFALILLLLWAIQSPNSTQKSAFDKTIPILTTATTVMANIQLACIAFFQIGFFLDFVSQWPILRNILFYIGLIFNYDTDALRQITHTFLLCFVISSGQFFKNSKSNFDNIPEYQKNNKSEDQFEQNLKNTEQIQSTKKRTLFGKFKSFNYTGMVTSYMPYVCIWIARICSFAIAYAYYGYPGFIVLTWLLLSFFVPVIFFVRYTVRIYLPLFTAAFFAIYFLNIQRLFNIYNVNHIFKPSPGQNIENEKNAPVEIHPVEVALFVFKIIFLLILAKYESDLTMQKNEFQDKIFKKFTNEKSNFLWQISFYVFKRIHILFLLLIFVFGIREINIYYIGLLYFFIKYTSSLESYRKSRAKLIIFTGFFIWIQYIWSYIKTQYNFDNPLSKDYIDSEYFTQLKHLFDMLTLQDQVKDGLNENTATQMLNSYMETPVPISQWIVLMLTVLMASVNSFFKKEETLQPNGQKKTVYFLGPSFDGKIKGMVSYESKADCYEAKNDNILIKKFPKLTKILVRVQMILSEIMIITIVIIQTLILAFQKPSIMYWGFLILSLLLQTFVISAIQENQKHFKKCIIMAKILLNYSVIVLILQIGYFFINDPRFLGQYGLGKALPEWEILKNLSEYLDIIGFHPPGKDKSIAKNFLSPILFQITASILKDSFFQKEKAFQKAQEEEQEINNQNNSRKSNAPLTPKLSQSRSTVVEDIEEKIDERDLVKLEYERIRFTVPYLIFKRIDQWRHFDSIASNFYLITCFVTVFYCTNWQISLFMFLQLSCVVIMSLRVAQELYKYGRIFKNDNQYQGLSDKGKERDRIDNSHFKTEYITIEQAYHQSKDYKLQASYKLQRIRKSSWYWQYWLLVVSMILMYPTPIMSDIVEKHQQFKNVVENAIYWLFWVGAYVSPNASVNNPTHVPIYIMIMVLVFDRVSIKWMENRFGCTREKIRYFKVLEEQIAKIVVNAPFKHISEIKFKEEKHYYNVIEKDLKTGEASIVGLNSDQTSQVKEVIKHKRAGCCSKNKQNDNNPVERHFITVMEAYAECQHIQEQFREPTEEMKEQQLKEELILGIKRKYTLEFRFGIKFLMEQCSLQLLLFSCAHKSNIISIFYLGLLLTLLVVQKKATGMRYIVYAVSSVLILEYILVLTNLTIANSPMNFPVPHQYYPCKVDSVLDLETNQRLNCNIPQEFVFPWYRKIEFLQKNYTLNETIVQNQLDWAQFLGIDVQFYKVNDVWFDFVNLMLLTMYFFMFGNQSKVLSQSKVSFSKTSSLEKTLRRYTKYQKERKDKLIQQLTSDPKLDENARELTKQAVSDEQEQFLGPTFYLQKLKKSIFIYNFTKKMKLFSFVGAQVLTTVLIFIIAVLHRSLMSLGYMLICTILFFNLKNFFYQDKLQRKGKQWINPLIIQGPLLWYSFIDIALQILYQMPNFPPQYGYHVYPPQDKIPPARYLGFDKIYDFNENAKDIDDLIAPNGDIIGYVAYLDFQNLAFLVLKAMNLFFIFLQSRIYSSDGFSKFRRVNLRTLMNMGVNYKKIIMTYIYNNKKLEEIIQLQQKKKQMYKKLEGLQQEVAIWRRQQSSLLSGIFPEPSVPTDGSLSNTIKTPLISNKQQSFLNPIDSEKTGNISKLLERDLTNVEKLAKQKEDALNSLNKNFKMEELRVLNEQDPNYETKKKAYKQVKAKLGRCAKLYLWMNKKFINQVLFVDSVDSATKLKEQTAKGILKSSNELKNAIRRDINLYIEKKIAKQKELKPNAKKKSDEEEIKLDELTETNEFTSLVGITVAVLECIPKAFFSQVSALAYLFMILSMILNAGLISLLYPLGVFGYALMEEGRPGRNFWNFMSAYTLFILFMKLIVNLDIWYAIGIQDEYQSINSWLILGLIRTEGILQLLVNVLPELLILGCIWAQIYYEILIGLHDQREIEVEDVKMARERFVSSFLLIFLKLSQFNEQARKIITATRRPNSVVKENNTFVNSMMNKAILPEEVKGPDGLTDKQRNQFYIDELKSIKKTLESGNRVGQMNKNKHRGVEDFSVYDPKDGDRKLLEDFILEKKTNNRLNISHVVDIEERHTIAKNIRNKNLTNVQSFVKNLGKKNYFKNLFPLIKEQKPGKDLYASITFWQFIICVYLITYYTHLDARGTQNLENTNQYSFYMVIMLFVQVAIMIIERFISRTNTRVQKKGQDASKVLHTNTISAVTMKQLSQTTSARRITTMVGGTLRNASSQEEYSKLQQYTQLSVTKITFQQILKWIIQIVLLILIHYVIFWLFPLASNDAIYGQPTCNVNSTSYPTYGCYDFKQNLHLLGFYLVLCQYFRLSALQIRHGYPDWKIPSSLTSKDDATHFNGNLIFYNLPFLLELKTILDWCFTKTSLDVFQWLELAEVNHAMFNAKNSNHSYYHRKLGTKISGGEKRFCGCFCLSIMLFFLVGPFLFFSDLRYIANENPVIDSKIGVTLHVYDSSVDPSERYEFPLFETNNPISMYKMEQEVFNNKSYNLRPETKFFDYTQVQIVQMKSIADEMWATPEDYRYRLRDLLTKSSNNSNIHVNITLSYEFDRMIPVLAKKAHGTNTKEVYGDEKKQFANLESSCSQTPQVNLANLTEGNDIQLGSYMPTTIKISNFIPTRVRLGETTEVKRLDIEKGIKNSTFINEYNVSLMYDCVSNYWSLVQERNDTDDGEGISVEVFSDIISQGFFSESSIMGVYLGVVFTVGTLLRTMVIYKTDRIFICDARDTDKIRNLIALIYRQRLEQNLKKEEEYFFLLFDILRSPELFKHLTGQSLKAELPPIKAVKEQRKAIQAQESSKISPQ